MESMSARQSRRTQEVLAPGFAEDLDKLPIEEVRRRRDEALAEREFQSFLRRLLQARRDILGAERRRRDSGDDSQSLVERLTAVLAEGPQGRGRGEAVRLNLAEADVAEAERRADALAGGSALHPPTSLDDSGLDESLALLEASERVVSAHRVAVIEALDRLQQELKRRYQEDLSAVPQP